MEADLYTQDTPAPEAWSITLTSAILLGIMGISLLFSLITLIISFRKKFYKQYLAQLMIMVILSESIYGISRFFGLFRKETFEAKSVHFVISLIQLIGSLFSDLITLLSTVFIALKIYDGIVNANKIFSSSGKMLISIIFIIVLSFILTIVFISLEIYFIDKTDLNQFCHLLGCMFNQTLNYYILGILIVITVTVVIIIFITLGFLCKKKRALTIDYSNDIQITSQVSSIQRKLLIFPIVSAIFWLWRLIYQIVSIEVPTDKFPVFIMWLYSIINGFRGMIYTLMYIISYEDLRMAYKNILCCCCITIKSEEDDQDGRFFEASGKQKCEELYDSNEL